MIETVVGAIAAPILEQLLKAGGAVAKDLKNTYGMQSFRSSEQLA